MKEAPYGRWESPISAEMTVFAQKTPRSTYIRVDGDAIYWTESRPYEKGRTVILRRTLEGVIEELTPPGFDVRSKVHEYGGLSFAVYKNRIYFVNSADQRLYVQKEKEAPQPLTELGIRLVEPIPTEQGIFCIGEEHLAGKVENFLALVDMTTGQMKRLDQGHDFYASPTLSPVGNKVAWLAWNHPQMPWDGTELWVADFENGALKNKTCVAGSKEEAIFQPQWSPEGILNYVSDRKGWWNFYAQDKRASLYPMEAEFGLPLWGLGVSTWGFSGRDGLLLCSYLQKGVGHLALLDSKKGTLTPLDVPGIEFSHVTMGKDFAVFLAGFPEEPRRLIKLDLKTGSYTFLDAPPPLALEPGFISSCEPISFPTENGETAHGYFYMPVNKSFRGLKGTLPPLLVMSHGGPTASVNGVFNLGIQYWTSRGWAVLDVNYRGSTGYGRLYRNSLKGQWGIADVQDCSNGALHLTKTGKVSDKRLIRGSSAGGYTTLAALAFTKTFSGGASYYGVADLELLARDTHKFEAHYLDTLLGPYPTEKALYQARSPLFHASEISCPVIFFQGGKDKVVPPNQAEAMYEALKKRGIRTELILYPDEEHGFRQAATLRDCLQKSSSSTLKF